MPDLTCNQVGCEAPATHRYDWPGRGECVSCAEHADRAAGVADAMGFAVRVEPLDPPVPMLMGRDLEGRSEQREGNDAISRLERCAQQHRRAAFSVGDGAATLEEAHLHAELATSYAVELLAHVVDRALVDLVEAVALFALVQQGAPPAIVEEHAAAYVDAIARVRAARGRVELQGQL